MPSLPPLNPDQITAAIAAFAHVIVGFVLPSLTSAFRVKASGMLPAVQNSYSAYFSVGINVAPKLPIAI